MPQKKESRPWFTERRLRAHGFILAVSLWSIYIWVLSTPGMRDRNGNLKGTDFLHFYTLGTLALKHRGGELYNMDAQAEVAAERVPDASGLRYLPLYPPQVSLLFAPLARLSYGWALAVWWGFTGAVYGICCYRIWRVCPSLENHGGTVALLGLANPAFFHLLAWGQNSALALGCFTLMLFASRAKRNWLAGLFFGCLIFKPQLALGPLIVFVATGAWRLLGGAVISAAGQLSAGVLYFGVAPFRSWLGTMWKVRSLLPLLEPKLYQTHCLRTFWSMLIPRQTIALFLYLVTSVAVLAMTIAISKRTNAASRSLRFPALVLSTVLVAPHLTVYDLVVLVPAFLVTADWLIGEARHVPGSAIAWALYLVYLLPLVGPLARWTHLQLSVIAMAALLVLMTRALIPGGVSPVGQLETTRGEFSV